jgi:hypothetical protein
VQSIGQENWRKIDEIFISNFPSAFSSSNSFMVERKKIGAFCVFFLPKKNRRCFRNEKCVLSGAGSFV